jgi:small conductance mechanosensitive channel
VSTGVLETGVWANLLRQWGQNAWTWFTENSLDWFFKILILVIILFAARALSRLVRRVVEQAIAKVNLSNLLRRMIVSTAANGVLFLGILIALSQVGISIGPLLAGLGIAGLIIGFALQDTLSNFASGMMILLYRPYDVGDLIDAGGEFGTVTDMSLVSTVIMTIDNQKLVVPNNLIWGGVIRNVTAQKIRRVDMTFGISYDDDIPKAERILGEILKAHELVLDDPEPVVRLHTLGESSVDFIVRPWVKTEDYWNVYWDVTREVKMRFDAEGVSIPFPQRDVHLYGPEAPAAAQSVRGEALAEPVSTANAE